MTTGKELRGIAFAKGDRIVAVCLDHYMVVSCATWSELEDALERMVNTHVAASFEMGRRPFEGLVEAPRRYWDMYNEALREEREREAEAARQERKSPWRYLPALFQIDSPRLAATT